jgi:hypothetical protein
LCAILGGFLTGFATNTYLNMSLFLAFAVLYPNQRIMLYFFIPIKVKWIGIVDAVLVAISFIFSNWTTRLFILLALLNLLLFVWRIPINAMRAARRRRRWEREAKRPNSDDYPFDL